jgi:hypothetical protein
MIVARQVKSAPYCEYGEKSGDLGHLRHPNPVEIALGFCKEYSQHSIRRGP